MTLSPWEQAQRLQRAQLGKLEAATLDDIVSILDWYIVQLIKRLRKTDTDLARIRKAEQVRDAVADRLELLIDKGVQTTADDVRRIWLDARQEIASQALATTPSAFLNPALGNLDAAVAFATQIQAGGGSQVWKTSLRRTLAGTVYEADILVKQAVMDNWGIQKLSKALRAHVIASEPINKAFGSQLADKVAADFRKVPKQYRGALKQIRYQADRIAVTELQLAKRQSEITTWTGDPYVQAIRWMRSPNRGYSPSSCACDVLATNDFYGLGPGIYPLDKVPLLPHPFCRCERMPVTSDIPTQPLRGTLQKHPKQATVPKRPGGQTRSKARDLTPAGVNRVRLATERALVG